VKLSDLLVDSEKIENGDWVEITPAAKGKPAFRVCVRGYGNADYRRMQSRMSTELNSEFGTHANIPPERYEEVDLTCLCDTILTGWDGLTEDDEATTIQFSADKAKEILANPDARLLRGMIESAARSITMRRKKKPDAVIKN
jgi:hypothetical protein